MPRPRGFVEEDVIQNALMAFWRRGYEATTVRILQDETGVGLKSLNRSFGEKHELFARVLSAYREMAAGILAQVFDPPGPGGIEAIVIMFEGLTQPTQEPSAIQNSGCLMVNTVFELQHTTDAIRAEVDAYRAMFRDRFRQALERDGITDAENRAEYLLGSMWGALSQIRLSGKTEAGAPMTGIVVQTVRSWGA